MATDKAHPVRKRRSYMAAVLLGTALSTLGVPQAQAAGSESTFRAVTDISRYCTACWRNARLPADCWGDCTQEVLGRLIQTIDLSSWGQVFKAEGAERQEFLRAIDAVKKRTQRYLKRSSTLNDVVADHGQQHEQIKRDQLEVVHTAAQQVLSDRQQQILRMSFEGWSVHEMADELGIPAERISDEKYKAIRKLRQHLKVEA